MHPYESSLSNLLTVVTRDVAGKDSAAGGDFARADSPYGRDLASSLEVDYGAIGGSSRVHGIGLHIVSGLYGEVEHIDREGFSFIRSGLLGRLQR